MRIKTDTLRGIATTYNVLAELPGQERRTTSSWPARTSIPSMPGRASTTTAVGRPALLEVAENLAKVKPQNTLRFAWWGAEESNLVGSTYYVNQPGAGRARQDRALPELRHDRLAEPRLLHLRRRRLRCGRAPARACWLGPDREDLREVLHLAGNPLQGDRLLRPLRLRPVHRCRHPVRWALHRRGRDQDGAGGRALGRHGRAGLRSLLPPGLRHVRQQQRLRARRTTRTPSPTPSCPTA